ncbi:MAG: cyclic nucleotide-binding domain-containing protein [Desulfobacterales bacterium]|nr:cyclic nucleotide-binding domain-containing protein [Desulfobacterales bacterium]
MLDIEKLKQINLFNNLNVDDLQKILPLCSIEKYRYGHLIIQGSSFNYDLYVILDGKVSIEMESAYYDRQENRLQACILRYEEVFGEAGFLDSSKREQLYVVADDDTSVLKIDGSKLHELMEKDNHIGYIIMHNIGRILSQRLAESNFRWRQTVIRFS